MQFLFGCWCHRLRAFPSSCSLALTSQALLYHYKAISPLLSAAASTVSYVEFYLLDLSSYRLPN